MLQVVRGPHLRLSLLETKTVITPSRFYLFGGRDDNRPHRMLLSHDVDFVPAQLSHFHPFRDFLSLKAATVGIY